MEKLVRFRNEFGKKWNNHLRGIVSGFERLRERIVSLIAERIARPKLRISEQVYITAQISVLLQAGIPFYESLISLSDQTNSKRLGRFFKKAAQKIQHGEKLSDFFGSEYGWHALAIALVRVGEICGSLSESFKYISTELSERRDAKKKIIGALLYPACIAICSVGLISAIVAFVFPKILPILSNVRGTLPVSTRIVISLSNFVKEYGILSAIILPAFIFLVLFLFRKMSRVRKNFELIVLKLPAIGNLFQIHSTSRILSTVSILTSSGIPLLDAVEKTAEVCGILVYKEALEKSIQLIESGENFSASLGNYPKLFPKLSINMLATAERTGLLPEISGRISKMYAEEFEDRVQTLSRLVEPALMMCLGLVVGFVAISIISPIYEITSNVRR